MGKEKIIRFLFGVSIVVFLGMVFATVKVIFFDCKYGQCVISECIEYNQECEENNYDPKTGQEIRNCCSDYETRVVSVRDWFIKQVLLYGVLCGSGLGIFVGILLMGRKGN